MSLVLETSVLRKFGLSPEDFGLLVFCNKNILPGKFVTDNKGIKKLWLYGFIDKTRKGFELNRSRLYRVLIAMREHESNIKERATSLAPKLMELFPEGRKPGTNLYWRGNKMEVTNKLSKFLTNYGEDYSDEQIVAATRNYVQSFNGIYDYMRVLKYFIWKSVIKQGETSSHIEEVSDLLTCLESADQEDTLRQDWTNTLL